MYLEEYEMDDKNLLALLKHLMNNDDISCAYKIAKIVSLKEQKCISQYWTNKLIDMDF